MKKYLLPVYLLWLTGCNQQQAPAAENTDSIKEQIAAIEKKQEDAYAMHNEEGMRIIESTCIDSLVYVGDDGGMLLSAKGYSHDLANGWIERPHDKVYRFYPNMVLVSAVSTSYSLHDGDSMYHKLRVTKIFSKDNNEWKMAYINISPFPVNYNQPVYGSTKRYTDYAGTFQVSPAMADTITLVNDTLYESTTGAPRSKLLPVNDSTFMVKDDLGRYVFNQNAGGKITHYSYVFADGQRLRFPKVR